MQMTIQKAAPMIFAIDPGTELSGFVLCDPRNAEAPIIRHGHIQNVLLRDGIKYAAGHIWPREIKAEPIIEDFEAWNPRARIESVAVCKWIGRFMEICAGRGSLPTLATRRDVCRRLTGDGQADKSAVKAFCVAQWGPTERQAIGTKKAGTGPLYGLRRHEFDALALAIYYAERLESERAQKVAR